VADARCCKPAALERGFSLIARACHAYLREFGASIALTDPNVCAIQSLRFSGIARIEVSRASCAKVVAREWTPADDLSAVRRESPAPRLHTRPELFSGARDGY